MMWFNFNLNEMAARWGIVLRLLFIVGYNVYWVPLYIDGIVDWGILGINQVFSNLLILKHWGTIAPVVAKRPAVQFGDNVLGTVLNPRSINAGDTMKIEFASSVSPAGHVPDPSISFFRSIFSQFMGNHIMITKAIPVTDIHVVGRAMGNGDREMWYILDYDYKGNRTGRFREILGHDYHRQEKRLASQSARDLAIERQNQLLMRSNLKEIMSVAEKLHQIVEWFPQNVVMTGHGSKTVNVENDGGIET